MKLEPEGIPELIEHNGWTIWRWTGWKGTKSVVLESISADCAKTCVVCHAPMLAGNVIELVQHRLPRHWICEYPDNRPDRIMGQWLAVKGEHFMARHMEVNVDNLVARFIVASFINGGEYKSGDSILVSTEGEFITEHTPDAAREIARQIGLERLKYLIDQVEAQQEVEADG